MQWMLKLYDKALVWAQHKHAPRYLAAVCFVEASVFPIPPYFMLAPMALARPTKAINYAAIATVGSVLGGMLGYFLGYLIFKPVVLPLLEYFGYVHAYETVINTFNAHGMLALLFLGLTPLPYKFIAIGAGFLLVPLHIFVLTSALSRGLKFFAVAWLIKMGGTDIDQLIRFTLGKLNLVLFRKRN